MSPPLIPEDADKGRIRWFSDRGCVVERDGRFEIFVAGVLVGAWDKDATQLRNALVVTLAAAPDVHLGKLAKAFRLSSERLRQLRIAFEAGGLQAITTPARIGRTPKVTPKLRAKLETLFESGLTIAEAQKKVRGLAFSTVGHVHTAWKKKQAEKSTAEENAATPAQTTLPGVKRIAPPPRREPEIVEDAGVRGGAFVQHAGSWLMLGMLQAQGLYEAATRACAARVPAAKLRVALDAVAIALTLGQGCIEGVRRVATPTAPHLLRATACPSPRTVRETMREMSRELGAVHFHVAMLAAYLADDGYRGRGVYYVDNHLRPYTGKRSVRRGWRMQDKRVRPGITDYYVHDERGRPLIRIDVPAHDSLTQWLGPIAKVLRDAVGTERRVLLAFDRGGAFPEAMSALREDGFEFVTYERRPYPLLSEAAFTEKLRLGEHDAVRFCESRINLRHGRGRVRRIAVLEADGHQVNLLATGSLSPAELIAVMRGRWAQENAFKHGVERWGINHLDRRHVEPYPPETIVPNPARRRLDRTLRAAAIREGDARRVLAQLADDDRRRERLERALREAITEQRELEARRSATPKRAPLSETELAGKLVRHDGRVKMAVDTVRIACANAEAALARMLGEHLDAPREAKKALANLLAAPGRIRVGLRTIAIDLAPAGTANELSAFRELLAAANRRKLTLPADPRHRRLRFRCQIQ